MDIPFVQVWSLRIPLTPKLLKWFYATTARPRPVIEVRNEADRPQPRLDRLTGKGMTTVVGRVRRDPILDLKFVVLSHNTIRGAAGGSIYNAELLVNEGLL